MISNELLLAILICALSFTGQVIESMIFSEGVDLYVNETELHLSREQENAIKPSTIRKFNMTGMKRIITQTENPISSYFTNANFSGAAPLSGSSSNDRSWCVAKESASPDSLQTALDWVCAYGGIDCEAIKLGSACYVPNNVYSHSSYAFNSYYQIHGHASGSCDFNGVATITSEDPSYPGCSFPFRFGQLGAMANAAKVWFPIALTLASLGLSIFA